MCITARVSYIGMLPWARDASTRQLVSCLVFFYPPTQTLASVRGRGVGMEFHLSSHAWHAREYYMEFLELAWCSLGVLAPVSTLH